MSSCQAERERDRKRGRGPFCQIERERERGSSGQAVVVLLSLLYSVKYCIRKVRGRGFCCQAVVVLFLCFILSSVAQREREREERIVLSRFIVVIPLVFQVLQRESESILLSSCSGAVSLLYFLSVVQVS